MLALTEFIKFLSACITPVAMISGVGLLLLTITNRFGRTIDRTRHLVTELEAINCKRPTDKKNEINILYKRSKLLRTSIAWIILGSIFSCLIIPLLFIMSIYNVDLKILGYIFFFSSIVCTLISLIFCFKDILLSLHAIEVETKEYVNHKK